MKQATVYDAQGRILGRYSSSNLEMLMRNLQGKLWIQGNVPANHYIKNGVAIAMSACPDLLDKKHQWDYTQERWVLDPVKTGSAVRNLRNEYLADIDKITPVWYASLTPEQQQELQVYRLALLAVPQQAGFPTDVEWPAKPQWL